MSKLQKAFILFYEEEYIVIQFKPFLRLYFFPITFLYEGLYSMLLFNMKNET